MISLSIDRTLDGAKNRHQIYKTIANNNSAHIDDTAAASPAPLSSTLGEKYSPGVNWSSLSRGNTTRLSTGLYVSGVSVPRMRTEI